MARGGRLWLLHHHLLLLCCCCCCYGRGDSIGAASGADVLLVLQPRTLNAFGDGLDNAQLMRLTGAGFDAGGGGGGDGAPRPLQLRVAANVSGGCAPTNVSLYLRYGGLPVVNVKRSTYPPGTWLDRPFDWQLNLLSDGQYRTLLVPAPPTPPDTDAAAALYGAAVVLDDSSAIQQQGLTRTCRTQLWARVESSATPATPRLPPGEASPAEATPEVAPLVRHSGSQPLTVRWLTADANETRSGQRGVAVRLASDAPVVRFTWTVWSPEDLGGTLQVDAKLVSDDGRNVTVRGCVSHTTADCRRGGSAFFNVTSGPQQEDERRRAKLLVPYPRHGAWFLTLEADCSEWGVAECGGNATLEVGVALWPCLEGGCGEHGRCLQYFSAGLIYAACVCYGGHAGWACSDDGGAVSSGAALAAVLLLTLSNLLFVPAVVLAYRRRFYPQCLMYTATTLFSTFYHACDQVEYRFCALPYSVLQFGDFYVSLASVWMTSLVVARLRLAESIQSAVGLAGIVGVAAAVHYSATSLPTFLVPIVGGVVLIAVSWLHHCFRRRSCYPGHKYWVRAVAPCLAFALVGLACFAFLETEENYFYVHSAWHGCIALAILFILPKERHADADADCGGGGGGGGGSGGTFVFETTPPPPTHPLPPSYTAWRASCESLATSR